MTFAMNIKTKYRIPVLLNNKKTIAENNKKKQSQGTLQAVPITRNNTKKYHLQGKIPNNNNLKETGNNRRNNNQREQCKNTTNTQQHKK